MMEMLPAATKSAKTTRKIFSRSTLRRVVGGVVPALCG